MVSFDKLDYCSTLNNTRALNDKRNFTFYHGDLTNPSEVFDCLERYQIDTVMHLTPLNLANRENAATSDVWASNLLARPIVR